MSWLFSRALVEASLGENFLDGEPCAQLNVMPTAQPFWRNDKTMEPSRLSRFGLTLRLLTEQDGEAVLMSFLEGFPARTSASLEREMASTESDQGFGFKCDGSFAKFDHEKSTWRTRQHSLLGGLEEFSETWPRWGSMQDGECSQQENLGPGILESEYGSWLPTIGKNEFKGCSRVRFRGSPEFRGAKMSEGLRNCESDPMYLTPLFAEHVMGWPATWTELAPLETDKFQSWLQQHGEFSQVRDAL